MGVIKWIMFSNYTWGENEQFTKCMELTIVKSRDKENYEKYQKCLNISYKSSDKTNEFII